MRPLYFLFGMLVGLCAGAVAFVIGADFLLEGLKQKIATFAALLIGVAVGGFVSFFAIQKLVVRKLRAVNKPTAETIFNNIFDLITNPTEVDREVWHQKLRSTFRGAIVWYSSAVGYYALFNAVVALVAIFAGMSATLIVFKQNQLISEQSIVLKSQNQSTLVQAILTESTRRAALAPTVSSIISEINQFSDTPIENTDQEYTKPPISENLIKRIKSVLPSLQPYIIADVDISTIDLEKPISKNVNLLYLSPERGQILKALLSSGIDLIGIEHEELDFSYSDMRNYSVNLYRDIDSYGECGIYDGKPLTIVPIINLENSDFSNSRISGLSLDIHSNVKLTNTQFNSSSLSFHYGSEKSNLENMKLWNSFLDVQSHVSLKDVQYSSIYNGCISLTDFSTYESYTSSDRRFPSLDGLKIKFEGETIVDLSDSQLRDFVFSKYLKDGQNVGASNYNLLIEQLHDEFGALYKLVTFEER